MALLTETSREWLALRENMPDAISSNTCYIGEVSVSCPFVIFKTSNFVIGSLTA